MLRYKVRTQSNVSLETERTKEEYVNMKMAILSFGDERACEGFKHVYKPTPMLLSKWKQPQRLYPFARKLVECVKSQNMSKRFFFFLDFFFHWHRNMTTEPQRETMYL